VLGVSVPFTSGSSLQLRGHLELRILGKVSVPFTSGSSLQLARQPVQSCGSWSFSSLYIGILAATGTGVRYHNNAPKFQFPLHRDPRCNGFMNVSKAYLDIRFSSLYIGILAATFRCLLHIVYVGFQFPLHRDPRCNRWEDENTITVSEFQFPLHRDPRCNKEWMEGLK